MDLSGWMAARSPAGPDVVWAPEAELADGTASLSGGVRVSQ